MSKNQNQHETLGVIKSAVFSGRTPVAVMINRSTSTGDLSFRFGLMRSGRISLVYYWSEDKIMQLATLAKVVAEVVMAKQMSALELNGEMFKKIIYDNPFLELVEEYIPNEQKKKASMTLGERARRR